MSCLKQICRATACVLMLLGTQAGGYAQGRPAPRFEGVRGGRVARQQVAVDEVETEPESAVRPLTELTRESRRFLDRSTEMTAKLAQQSTSAFTRGLMPLPDYLNQLAVGAEVDLRAADLTDPQGRVPVYRRQVELLEDAWQRVAFREPGVRGWRSDALLAELALTEARLNLAEANGDVEAMAALRADSEILSRAHFDQQELDYQIAFASLPMLTNAARMSVDASLARNPGSRTVAALRQGRQTYLELALVQAEDWSTIDAGIGRADRVAAARLDLEMAEVEAALATEPVELTRETVSRVSGEFSELFEQQQEFYRYGTASLYELTRTWVAWHDVHRAAVLNSDDAVDEAEAARRGDALRGLQSLAENEFDLRGRHAADVTFVQLAGQLDGLDELYDEVEPRVEYLP